MRTQAGIEPNGAITAGVAAWMAVWLPGRAWWLVANCCLAAAVPFGVTFVVRKQSTSLPVMHRVAVRSRAA